MEDIRPTDLVTGESVIALLAENASLRATAIAAMDARSTIIESLSKGTQPTQTMTPLRLKIFTAAAEIAGEVEKGVAERRSVLRDFDLLDALNTEAVWLFRNSGKRRPSHHTARLTTIAALALTALVCGKEG